MSLKSLIQSEDQLSTLTKTLREQLTPEHLVSLLTEKTITDPALQQQLKQAVGKKATKKLKTRTADALAAQLLSFNNPNEMFAHYKNQLLYNQFAVRWSHKYGEDLLTFYAPKGMELTRVDLAAIAKLEWEPTNPLEILSEPEFTATNITADQLPEGDMALLPNVLDDSRVSACCVTLSPLSSPEVAFNKALNGYIDEILLDVEADNFEYSNNEFLSEADDFSVFSINRPSITSSSAFFKLLTTRLLDACGIEPDSALRSVTEQRVSDPRGVHFEADGHTLSFAEDGRWVALYQQSTQRILGIAGTLLNEEDVRKPDFMDKPTSV